MTILPLLKIILASASKQRLFLLRQIGIDPIVKISNYDEDLSKSLPVNEFVEEIARNKALIVANEMRNEVYDYIIGCDTVILHNGEIIGKPKDREEAVSTLQRLSNSTHYVYTGVALINSNAKCEVFHVCTMVKFSDIPRVIIDKYVDCGEAMGRAGSYAIQGQGAMFVQHIEGCYYNVVGLPINLIMRKLWNELEN